MSTFSELRTKVAGFYHDLTAASSVTAGPVVTGGEQAARAAVRKVMSCRVEADAAASTVIAERAIFGFPSSEFPGGAKVIAVHLRTSSLVTASSTVYATDTFVQRDSAGVNNLTAATLKTDLTSNGGIGTATAFLGYGATLATTLSQLNIPADGCLTLTRAKASTGTAMPECIYTVTVEAL